ncbi:MAG: nitroreductase family protein [Lachnospiraceae bacterium]|nr:nitroreductase family protein [Lachnospiraceae bacterium]
MTAIEIMKARHSYRGKFKTEPVPREDLRTILEAGTVAPSGCNMQTTSFICVDDPEVLKQIHSVMNPLLAETAPVLICVLTQRSLAWKGRSYATQDYSAAIENMLLAIVELGYQSCWIEGQMTDENHVGDEIANILNVPEDYELVCILPVGIAEEDLFIPRKKTFEERAWFNSFMKV